MKRRKMIEQLKELLTMQKALDAAIFRDKGITAYPVDNMKIALFVELGEMMNEFPTKFKHWKKSAVDNREKGLEEYVDALHFMLSLYNHYCDIEILDEDPTFHYESNLDLLAGFGDLVNYLVRCVEQCDGGNGIKALFEIGNFLEFEWEEIYEAYMNKNSVNHQRNKNGY